MPKKVKPAAKPKEPEPPEIITSSLSVSELKMKDLMWSMKLIVHYIMPKSYHDFIVRFIFNEEPFLNNIAELEMKLGGSKNMRLFKDMDRDEIEDARETIDEIKADMAKKKKECVTIEFLGEVTNIKYSAGDTILDLRIPDHIINPVNNVKTMFGYYTLELQPKI